MSPNTHIIDMSAEALQDLNDALEDEGLDIVFEIESDDEDDFAFYRLPGTTTARTRISLFTKASECWKIARELFPDAEPQENDEG